MLYVEKLLKNMIGRVVIYSVLLIRGHISEIISIVEELKGEMVIVVEGSQEVEEEITFETTIKEDVDMYIEKGMSTKDAIKEVAKQRNLNKNSVYQEYHSK